MSNAMAKMGKLPAFRPPLPNEFNPDTARKWSDVVSGWLDRAVRENNQITQSFNPMNEDHDLEQKGVPITWTAFPALIAKDDSDNADRWRRADESRGGAGGKERGRQDEYSEWSVNRDANNRITDVTFTSEGPEYWAHFVEHQPQDAIKVIEEMNGITGVKLEELLDENRKYNKKNKYNQKTTGPIIGLIHDASQLYDEVAIVADATVHRKHPDGSPVTDRDELIVCSNYGVSGRNSDPEIGIQVNTIARKNVKVQIKDPIAIFIHSINKGNFRLNMTGDEEDQDLKPVPVAWWNEQRGNFAHAQGLRLKIHNKTGVTATGESQNGRLLDVTDIWDKNGGDFVRWGAQFADHIKIGATGIVAPGKKGELYPCKEKLSVVSKVFSAVSTAAATAVGAQDEQQEGYGRSGRYS